MQLAGGNTAAAAGADARGSDINGGANNSPALHAAAVIWGEQLESLVDVLLSSTNTDGLEVLLQEAQAKESALQVDVDTLSAKLMEISMSVPEAAEGDDDSTPASDGAPHT